MKHQKTNAATTTREAAMTTTKQRPITATIRAVSYARFSSDAQRASSIEDQQRNIQRRCDVEGWTIVHQYADAAMSGASSDRPDYQRMLKAAARGEFQILVIDDLSRLSRDSLEAEKSIRRLEFSGVRLIAVSDGYDSDSKSRKIQRGFKNLMNETFLDDLRERVHRGQTGQALKGRWCGGRVYGFALKPVLDSSQRDAYGDAAQIGTQLVVDRKQAPIVREIFDLFIAGQSHRAIAATLNARGVPSVGMAWRRKVHRSRGWVQSAIRVILANRLYIGEVTWNKTRFIRDPNTEKIVRRARPKSEWIVRQDESLRIVSDAVFAKAQTRTKVRSNSDVRLKSGGKAKYLLSGLLKCGVCGGHFIFADVAKYACSTYVNGGASACAHKTRVRKDVLEAKLVDPILHELLSPENVKLMARETEKRFGERVRAAQRKGVDVPRELADLDARLARLHDRLRRGDPDLTDDELQAAIAKVEAKRQELAVTQSAGSTAKILTLLPRAADAFRDAIMEGRDGKHPEKAAKARLLLRDLIGPVTIKTEGDGSVWGEYETRPAVLFRGVADTDGRGDRI